LLPRFQKPAGCADCVLERQGTGYAPVDGPLGSRITFVAEALGEDETFSGRPLTGAAGGVHTRVCMRAGITREMTRADNCCRCRPPNNWFDEQASWYYPALTHCRQYLNQTLAQVPENSVVVPLGATALKSILNLHGVEGIAVKDFHGTVTRSPDDRYWVVPSFHPSHLQRGAMSLLEIVTNDYRTAKTISEKGFVRSPVNLVVDPGTDWYARWVDDHLAKVAANPEQVHTSIDTEYLEKMGGDESEIDLVAGAKSPLTRINGANDGTTGWTVPYIGDYITITEKLFAGLARLNGFVWLWNKYADWDKLHAAGHTLDGIVAYDGMWAWKYLQSDIPRGLGFVAPLASDFGAWKHWGKLKEREGEYAAADGVQNWRTCMWVFRALHAAGMWNVFVNDWHERDYYVLQPSRALGVPVDRPALEQFHADLQTKQTEILERIKTIGAEGTLKPKAGYAKKPTAYRCDTCGTSPVIGSHNCVPKSQRKERVVEDHGTGPETIEYENVPDLQEIPAKPPESIVSTSKAKGKRKSEAKQAYTAEGVSLVHRVVHTDVRICRACGKVGVGASHDCKKAQNARTAAAGDRVPGVGGSDDQSRQHLFTQYQPADRWFWQIPYNPDSWQQLLGYIERAGHTPGTHRKTKKPTTDSQTLKRLAAETKDPLYSATLDFRAVQKVDSTYALGVLTRMDENDRIHPEIVPIPSTLRDSSRGPNLQNVVADKGEDTGPQSLASGFRRCVKSRDGLPPNTTEEMYQDWVRRWGV